MLDGESGVPDYSAHRKGIDWVLSRQEDPPCPIAHGNVTALPDYLKPCLFQCSYGPEVIDARNTRHPLHFQPLDGDFCNSSHVYIDFGH